MSSDLSTIITEETWTNVTKTLVSRKVALRLKTLVCGISLSTLMQMLFRLYNV